MPVNPMAIRIEAEPLRSLGFASISGTYAAIGTALVNPSRILMVQNLTDEDLVFSYDGLNDHFVVPNNGFVLLDLTANKVHNGGAFIAQGTIIYVKEIGNPTLGSVYVSTWFGAI